MGVDVKRCASTSASSRDAVCGRAHARGGAVKGHAAKFVRGGQRSLSQASARTYARGERMRGGARRSAPVQVHLICVRNRHNRHNRHNRTSTVCIVTRHNSQGNRTTQSNRQHTISTHDTALPRPRTRSRTTLLRSAAGETPRLGETGRHTPFAVSAHIF